MFTFDTKKKSENGFIALISILIISVVLLTSTLALAQFGIANRFFILNLEQKAASEKLAEGCIHFGRIQTYNDSTYTVQPNDNAYIKLGGKGCKIYSLSSDGTHTTIQAVATSSKTYTNLEVVIVTGTGELVSWNEVAQF